MTKNKGFVHTNNEGRVLACQNPDACPFGTAATTAEESQALYVKKISELLSSSSVICDEERIKNRRYEIYNGIQYVALKDMTASDLGNYLIRSGRQLGFNDKKLESAIALATALHENQSRGARGTLKRTPYIEHPLRNTIRLIRLGNTEQDVIFAAVLHDTVEDGSIDFVKKFGEGRFGNDGLDEVQARVLLENYIEKHFGGRVLNAVHKVTNEYFSRRQWSELTQEEKANLYLNHVRNSIKNDPDALLVKVSDFIDNATGLYHSDVKGREKRTFRQAKKYLPVASVFRDEVHSVNDLNVSDEGRREILLKMDRTETRLKNIIRKYKSLGA